MYTVYRLATLISFALVFGSAAPVQAQDNVVLQWNTALLQSVRAGFAPMYAARGFAIVHTCMYDAWAAYDPTAVGTQLGGILRRPVAEHTLANKERAISYAAYRALVDLFPARTSSFNAVMAALGYDHTDTSADLTTPTGIGNQACAALLAVRHADGSNQLAGYADSTGYAPSNLATPISPANPDRWQPLGPQVFLAPHWGRVTPFAMTSADQFRPLPPAAFGSNEFEHQAREIVDLSAKLDDRRKAIALYWADGPNTETPPGHWNLFAQFVSRRDAHTVDEDAKMFFVLGNALLDASIAVWDCKRFFDYSRPVTAIRFLYAARDIEAWGGPGLGTQTIPGDTFRSYIATPPFAEYTSGHSAFSSSSAEVLKLFTGSDVFGAFHTVSAASFSVPEPAPSVDVTLFWPTFEDAANEAGLSRRYGGIHFKDGDLASRKMGRQIGALVWHKAQTFFNGTATMP